MAPTWSYPDQGTTSAAHKMNIGGIVWSTSRIGFKSQDKTALKNTFRLSDKIFGRVYMERSLRNVAVYSSVNKKPLENAISRHVARLSSGHSSNGAVYCVKPQ